MLQLSAAGKRFGQKLLFEDANWLITPDERTGLVGGNGTGKSTLLKILGGLETLDYGQLTRVKGTTLGYLPQDGLALRGKTVFAECLSVFDPIFALEREAEQITHVLSTADPKSKEYLAAADRYSDIADHLHVHDIYTLDSQVGAVLGGLGFSKEDWERKTEEFSGGWQMRIALAKLLLQKPSLLLLDEPTNHLDLESRNWLENYLHDYPNAYILISHDRYFLDVTVNKTIELWNKRMHVYHGNYEKYLVQKEERRTQLMNAYKNQRDRIDALEAFINRFRYQATKAKQVQSRIKELEKIERIEVPEEEATIHFTIPQPPVSGRTVLEVNGLKKVYPMPAVEGQPAADKLIFEGLNFTIERGERIALVGANGAGKSTLIRLLSRQEESTAGSIREGHNVLTDFFAQDQYKVLDPNAQMLDDIAGIAPKVPVVELRSLLGCFMFSGDDVFKKLGVLSGGERNRYAMAKMLVSPSNFLLLDEPTNHLDLRAKDVLLEAIANFTGTVLFVSHDRYFIDGLATRVFEVEDHRLHIYPGNYEDYLYRKSGGPQKTSDSLAAFNAPAPKPSRTSTPSAATPSAPTTKPGAPHLASEMWDAESSGQAPAPPSDPVILSEGRSPQSKDPDALRTTSTNLTSPPPTLTPGAPHLASEMWDTKASGPPLASKPPARRLNPLKLRQLEDRVAAIEQKLPGLESLILAVEEKLGHYSSAADAQRTAVELESLRAQRTALLAEWESAASTLEEQTTAV